MSLPKIDTFAGEHSFLSNFYQCEVTHEGVTYPSVENFYQAMKTTDKSKRKEFLHVSAGVSKRMGRKITLRPDWNRVKLSVMMYGLREKFKHPILRKKLLDTGSTVLVEGNTWGDTYWGVCGGKGQNMLGQLLMKVREEIRNAHQG